MKQVNDCQGVSDVRYMASDRQRAARRSKKKKNPQANPRTEPLSSLARSLFGPILVARYSSSLFYILRCYPIAPPLTTATPRLVSPSVLTARASCTHLSTRIDNTSPHTRYIHPIEKYDSPHDYPLPPFRSLTRLCRACSKAKAWPGSGRQPMQPRFRIHLR